MSQIQGLQRDRRLEGPTGKAVLVGEWFLLLESGVERDRARAEWLWERKWAGKWRLHDLLRLLVVLRLVLPLVLRLVRRQRVLLKHRDITTNLVGRGRSERFGCEVEGLVESEETQKGWCAGEC